MKPLRPVEPRGPLFADDINAERAEVDRLGKLSIDGPAGTELQSSSTGMQLTVPAAFVGCWAEISNPDNTAGGPWAWQEMRPIAGAAFEIKNPGRYGTEVKDPLYHPGHATLTDGTVAFIMKGAVRSDGQFVQQDWLVVGVCCGGSETTPPILGTLHQYTNNNTSQSFFTSGIYVWQPTLQRWVVDTCLQAGPLPEMPSGNWSQSTIRMGSPNNPNDGWRTIEVPWTPGAGGLWLEGVAPIDPTINFITNQGLCFNPNNKPFRWRQNFGFSTPNWALGSVWIFENPLLEPSPGMMLEMLPGAAFVHGGMFDERAWIPSGPSIPDCGCG